jgi:hypothetical protein
MRHHLKIGYVPLNFDLVSAPGDYRRFPEYAKIRGIKFELAKENEKYDLVIVSQGADITVWSKYPYGVVVYDFVDSYLSIPYTNIKGLLRGLIKFLTRKHNKLELNYWKSVQKMCERSDAVVCSTNSQREDILPFCNNTKVILDIQDSVVGDVKEMYETKDVFKIVWEGLPCNLYQVKLISKVLRQLSQKYNIELHIITDPFIPSALGNFFRISTKLEVEKIFHNTVFHEWNKETLSEIVRNCDLAVIPVDMGYPLTSGKPENKLLLFWRMGITVITSNTHAYKEAMRKSGVNLTCSNHDDWFNKIQNLIINKELRMDAAVLGMKYANKYSSTNRLLRKWDEVFSSIGFDFTSKIDDNQYTVNINAEN